MSFLSVMRQTSHLQSFCSHIFQELLKPISLYHNRQPPPLLLYITFEKREELFYLDKVSTGGAI